MLDDRARQVGLATLLAVAAVAGAYVLGGLAAAGLAGLLAYGLAVFVLGLHNAGVAGAAVVATVAVVAVVEAGVDEPPPLEREALREARGEVGRLVREQEEARGEAARLREEALRLQGMLEDAGRRVERLESAARQRRDSPGRDGRRGGRAPR